MFNRNVNVKNMLFNKDFWHDTIKYNEHRYILVIHSVLYFVGFYHIHWFLFDWKQYVYYFMEISSDCKTYIFRVDSRFGPSQWETPLQVKPFLIVLVET